MTTTPAPAPATFPVTVARPERRVSVLRRVPFRPASTGVEPDVTDGSHSAIWFWVRTWTGPYDALLVPVASVITSRNECAPSARPAVS